MAGIKPPLIGVQPANSRYICFYGYDSKNKKSNEIYQGFELENSKFLITYEVYNFPITPDDSILVNVLNPNFPKMSLDSLYLNREERDLKYVLEEKYQLLQKIPVKYYIEADAKLKFKADHALSYPLMLTKDKCKHDLTRKYCEVLIIHKTNRGYFIMYCYCNKKRQKNECLKIAEGVFRNREP